MGFKKRKSVVNKLRVWSWSCQTELEQDRCLLHHSHFKSDTDSFPDFCRKFQILASYQPYDIIIFDINSKSIILKADGSCLTWTVEDLSRRSEWNFGRSWMKIVVLFSDRPVLPRKTVHIRLNPWKLLFQTMNMVYWAKRGHKPSRAYCKVSAKGIKIVLDSDFMPFFQLTIDKAVISDHFSCMRT